MNWGDIQIESLKKMFLNKNDLTVAELPTYKQSKDYKTYLFSMPQACNEAVNYIVAKLGANEVFDTITRTNTNDYYDLSDLFSDYKRLKSVMCPNGVTWSKASENILHIEDWNDGDIKVLYEVKPTIIDSNSESSQEIEIKKEYSRLIPLYIAGEVYKDDDITQATMYMNEFMTQVDSFAKDRENYTTPKIERTYGIW